MDFILRDGYICDLDYFEEIPLQNILLDFINYPLWLWVDSVDPVESNLDVSSYYLRELIWGFLHPPLFNEVSTPGKDSRTYNIKIHSNRHTELEKLQKDIFNLVNVLVEDESNANYDSLKEPDIKYRINITNGKIEETYSIASIDSYCLFAISNLARRDMLIKKCINCGKFFVPTSRTDEQYCDNIFKNDRTCKQIGWERKSKENPVYREFRKAYNRNRKFIISKEAILPSEIYKLLQKEFNLWKYESNNKMELVKESKISLGDFKDWINEYDVNLRLLVKYVTDASEISSKEFKELMKTYRL